MARLTLRQRKALMGYLFTLPFTLGFVFVFLYPFFQSIWFSVTELEITREGYVTSFVGLQNYHYALRINPNFTRQLIETTGTMTVSVFWILVFSFFASMLLNQSFRGRIVARTVFFLPVILASGIILRMEQHDYMTGILETGIEEVQAFLATPFLQSYLVHLRLPENLITNVLLAVDRVPEIIRASGIQILVFLAGLQSIPPDLYEVSEVEGATGWENFWLITLPLLSPLILTNIVYSIVDFFTASGNTVVETVRTTSFSGAGFGVGSAMSWIYFATIVIILTVVFGIVSRFVFYQE